MLNFVSSSTDELAGAVDNGNGGIGGCGGSVGKCAPDAVTGPGSDTGAPSEDGNIVKDLLSFSDAVCWHGYVEVISGRNPQPCGQWIGQILPQSHGTAVRGCYGMVVKPAVHQWCSPIIDAILSGSGLEVLQNRA